MTNAPEMLFLPDTLADWPWPRSMNPHYDEAKAESNAWFHSFKAFSTRSQYAFDKGDFARLAALAYPHVSKDHLRSACDLMNLFFVIDEYTDVESEGVVRDMVNIVIDAFKNPHKPRPAGEVVLGEIARQYWESAIRLASHNSQKHMIESFTAYLESVVQQAADRENTKYHSIASYLAARHENIGTRPSYAVMEFDLDLDDDIIYHPIIVELTENITELILLDNDMASYNKEQATGDDSYNIVTLAMREFNIGLDAAMDWVVKYHAEVQKTFLQGLKRVPSWGPDLDRQVQQYLDGLANWARGNACWHFESGRYFGSKCLEVQRTRRVPLLPKISRQNCNEPIQGEKIIIPLIEELEATA